ncbi:hypothetical protein [Paracoccus sp. TOH]|nr:hypothetical protein [Paracoccus sp. TOH]WJS86732.1 hypothetical protein NBE95_19920 [Paracoccus sp. TOH]
MMQQHYAIRPRRGHRARLLSAEMLARFFDNRDPRAWTDPVPVCATEWVA